FDDAERFLKRLGAGLAEDLADLAQSSVRNALNPAGNIDDLVNQVKDTAEELGKRSAWSDCERKKARKKALDRMSTPEGWADATLGALEFLAFEGLFGDGCFVAGTLVMTESGLKE